MKMQIQIKLIACLFVFLGFIGCSNDENPLKEDDAKSDSGKETFITVSLSFPKSISELRTTEDPNATQDEAKITKIDLFIYGEPGYFLSHKTLNVSDFEQVTTNENLDKYVYNASEKIATTTGNKKLFVGVNLPETIINSLLHKGNSELTQVEKILTRDDLINSDGFVMTSFMKECTFTLDENDETNNPTLVVQRMLAKVTVQTAKNMEVTGVPGKVDNLKFAINNFNERSFLIQGNAPEYKDPNWASGSYNASHFTQATASDYVNINDHTTLKPEDFNALYAAENTSEDHKSKEITRVTIRGTFIPKEMIVYKNGINKNDGYKFEDCIITNPETFWTVTVYNPNPEMAFFYNENIAKDYAADNNLTANDIDIFTNGFCYWDMFLNRNKWDVIRNDYYKSTITRIVAPGRSTPDLTDPDNPPASDVEIQFDVDVKNWNIPVLNDYELEP